MAMTNSQTNGDVTVVYFTEQQILDETKISQLAQELDLLAGKVAGGKMLINFSAVQYMSSSVLGKLIRLNKKCKLDKTDLKMSNISPSIMEVFKITNLHKVFEIHDEEANAIAAYNKKKWGLL